MEARERGRRRGDRSVPAGRGQVPAHAGLHPRARPRSHAVLADHARAAGQAGRRRARGGRRSRAKVHVTFSVPTLDERIWRTTEPGTAPPAASARDRSHPRRRRDRHRVSRSRRCSPASPTSPSSWPTSCARRGRRARAASGRTSSTCVREPASTSSRRSRATGPSSLPEYERLYAGRCVPPVRRRPSTTRAGRPPAGAGRPGSRDARRSGPRPSRSSSR